MLTGVTSSIVRRARLTLVIVAAILAIQVTAGAGVFRHLSVGGFYPAGAESTRADTAMDTDLAEGAPNVVLAIQAPDPVDSPRIAREAAALTSRLAAEPGVSAVTSYWNQPADVRAALRSPDGRTALVSARLTGGEDVRKATMNRIFPGYDGVRGDLVVRFGGQLAAEREVTIRSQDDLHRLELFAMPLAGVLLWLVFGGVIAALLPLAVGGAAIITVTCALRVLSEFTHVSIYSINIATALSLGLAVDYGLFMISRYRDEIAAGQTREAAIARMNQTAGRTVLFSALTVALCLASLLVVPLYYFRSVAFAAIVVVISAALGAIVLLPALLALVGDRVAQRRGLGSRLTARWTRKQAGDPTASGWYRFAAFVMRRPIPLATAALGLLVLLALPGLGARFALPDQTALPASAESSQVARLVATEFPQAPDGALYILAEHPMTPAQTADLAGQTSSVAGVMAVDSAVGRFVGGRLLPSPDDFSVRYQGSNASWLDVQLAAAPQSPRATAIVARVRAVTEPLGLLVGGISAHLVDTQRTVGHALLLAVMILAGSTMLLLFLFTGSVLIPVKAMLLGLLSLGATFGTMVWIFQDDHLGWLIGGFQSAGTIEMTTPIILLATAFGLAMDYEMFLVSRIREAYQASGDNARSVALGLQQSGRVVTSAALLFLAVMLAFAASPLSVVKLVGFGLAFAVLLDVTVIRAVLVPAIMRLLGPATWWAPSWLRRVHGRIGLTEDGPAPAAPAPTVVSSAER